ncbi:DNA topoisomerase [Achromobacter aloeverae]
MKALIIAEKPSVARDIAAALGGFQKKGEWLERDDAIVSSGIGHLVKLDGPPWTIRGLEGLPAIPDVFKLNPIASTESQLKLVQKLMVRPDVTSIINACDAGREGELIFRLIYEFAQTRKPVKRMWLQSMTTGAIKEAYRSLKAGQAYDALGAAARCRSEADWLIGINASRGMTAMHEILTGERQLRTVGRVQTPTLGILVHREIAIQIFKPTSFWEIHANFQVAAGQYQARWCNPRQSQTKLGAQEATEEDQAEDGHGEADAGYRIWDEARAKAILAMCQGQNPTSAVDVSKRTTSAPPHLFDLTSLQREANRRFKFSAKKTLDLAQALYEKHKALTYPRTDSNALPEDYVSKTILTVQALEQEAGGNYAQHAQRILAGNWVKPNKRIFNDAKISDHFAIIPTGNFPAGLDANEVKIFDLVVRRFLAAFHPAAQYDSTQRTTVVAGETFLANGRVLVEPGWLSVYGQEADLNDGGADKQPALCALGTGEVPRTIAMALKALKTKPPARFTEAALLQAMETAGKLVDDEDLRDAMKERGLGTPATRAATIESLLADKDSKGNPIQPYVTREGKAQHLVPTEKGITLIQFLEAQGLGTLASPALTGEWESKLLQVEKAKTSSAEFMAEIRNFTVQLVDTLKARAASVPQIAAADLGAPCPVCRKGLKASSRGFECVCGFKLGRTVARRVLADDEARQLFSSGKTALLQGFHSTAKNKDFAAMLAITAEGKVEFQFPPRDAAAAPIGGKQYPCSACGKPMRLRTGTKGNFWGCTGYPDCKNTQPDDGGKPGIRAQQVAGAMSKDEVNRHAADKPTGIADGPCPACGKGTLVRKPGKQGGYFLGCTTFPACKHFQWDRR